MSRSVSDSIRNLGFHQANPQDNQVLLGLMSAYKSPKPVIQYDRELNLIKLFLSINKASIATGIPTGNISRTCNGKRHSAGGYVWKYKEEV